MYQGTTPTLVFMVPGVDLTEAKAWVTLVSGNKEWDFTGDRVTVAYEDGQSLLTIALTQEETFKLPVGSLKAQVRWVDADEQAWATEEASLQVSGVLMKKVIRYADPDADAEEE